MPSEHDDGSVSTTILEAARAGRDDAWTSIWQLYSPRVYRQCRRLGLTPQEAEEVTLSVFEKVWAKLSAFTRVSEEHSLGAWIQRITQTTALDYHRARRQSPLLVGHDEHLAMTVQPTDDSSSWKPSDLWLVFWRAMALVENDCSERVWECFRMAKLQDLSHQEIAERLGLTTTNVSTIVHRVLERIREEARRQLNQS